MSDSSYAAFVSYRRIPPDDGVSWDLHRRLEQFKVPRSLRSGSSPRLGRVFIDTGEVGAGRLSSSLQEATDSSAALIIVCSPQTPASPWVSEEAQSFLSRHQLGAPVIVILLGGTVAESCPAVIRELFERAGAPRPTLVFADPDTLSSRTRRRRMLSAVTDRVASALLKTDLATLSQGVRGERRKARTVVALAMAVALALAAIVVVPINTADKWAVMAETRIPSPRDYSFPFIDGTDSRVQLGFAFPGAPGSLWEWDPSRGRAYSVTPDWRLESPDGRFVLYTERTTSQLMVRDRVRQTRRRIDIPPPSAGSLLQPKFDRDARLVLFPDVNVDRLAIRIWSLENAREIAVVDVGEVPDVPFAVLGERNDLPPGPSPAARRAAQWNATATRLWSSILVAGAHLIASDANAPWSPVVRQLPSGAETARIALPGYRYAIPMAVNSDNLALLAAADAQHPALCVWQLRAMRAAGCVGLAPSIDPEVTVFTPSGQHLALLGPHTMALFRVAPLQLIVDVPAKESVKYVSGTDESRTDGWVFWTSGGATFRWSSKGERDPVRTSGVDVHQIKQIVWSSPGERLAVRYERAVDLINTRTWSRVTRLETSDAWSAITVTVDHNNLSAQTVNGRLVIATLLDGTIVGELSNVGGNDHRAFVDPNCRRIEVLSAAGQIMRYRFGSMLFNRWFRPATCPVEPS